MTLYVCPDCEILINCLSIQASHYLCKCGYEGTLYTHNEWPKNYILTLMILRDYSKEVFFSLREQRSVDTRHYQSKVYCYNSKINDLCKRYGVNFNDIERHSI